MTAPAPAAASPTGSAPAAGSTPASRCRVLGLDPGSRVTGWGVVEERRGRLHPVEYGVVRCRAADPLVTRLGILHREIAAVVDRLEPDELAVESVFSAASAGSALTLGHARGAVLVAAGGRPVAEYAPRAVKQAITGYGAAGKGPVAAMVARRLGLSAPPTPEDAADALAVAVCHLDARRAAGRAARARPVPPPPAPRRPASRKPAGPARAP